MSSKSWELEGRIDVGIRSNAKVWKHFSHELLSTHDFTLFQQENISLKSQDFLVILVCLSVATLGKFSAFSLQKKISVVFECQKISKNKHTYTHKLTGSRVVHDVDLAKLEEKMEYLQLWNYLSSSHILCVFKYFYPPTLKVNSAL